MKVLLFANTDWYFYNFRLSLIKHIIKEGHQVVLVSPEGAYCHQLKKLQAEFVSLDVARNEASLVREIKTLWGLWKIYRCHRPDVVHHFTLKCVFYGLIASRLAGLKKSVNALTGMGYVFTSEKKSVRLLKFFITKTVQLLLRKNNDAVVVQNVFDYRYIFNKKIVNKRNLHLIEGSGVEVGSFSVKEHQETESIKVFFASRLIRDKGIYELLESSKIVLKKNPNIKYIIAGDIDTGHPTSIQNSDIEYWQNYKNIEFVGHVENMSGALQQPDIVVLPSYREGLPRILIEAAASGLPIVTTDVPGCNAIVSDYDNGILVPPRNIQLLADAVLQLASSVSLRQALGMKGRLLAEKRFDANIINTQTVSLYC